jgi:hypothetical protein
VYARLVNAETTHKNDPAHRNYFSYHSNTPCYGARETESFWAIPTRKL